MRCELALLIVALGALNGCERADLSGPPVARLGRDECVSCGMIISEDRCSGALLVESEGEREYRLFDDLGCLLDYERENALRLRVVATFARDHDTGEWITSASPTFLFGTGEHIRTPMGSGIVAYGTRERGEAAQRRSGGDMMDARQVSAARQDWMERRFGKSGSPR